MSAKMNKILFRGVKMKKEIVVGIMAFLMAGVLLSGCRVVTADSGNNDTRHYDFSDFDSVEIGSAFDFEIVRSDSFSVSITTDDNMFEHIRVKEHGETLTIDVASRINLFTIFGLGSSTRKAVITMPHLTELSVSGASEGEISGFGFTEELEVDVSGASKVTFPGLAAGDIDLDASGASLVWLEGSVRNLEIDASGASSIDGDIEADSIDLDLSGASSARLSGSAGDAIIEGSGASRFNLADLILNDADVTLTGASTADVNLDGRLDVSLSGASSLNFKGTPTMGRIDISGGSSINQE